MGHLPLAPQLQCQQRWVLGPWEPGNGARWGPRRFANGAARFLRFPPYSTRYIRRMAKGWTFQSLIDEKMTVRAHCHRARCNHSQVLDLVKLRDRFGPDAPAMADDLIPKLKCAKCGSKKVGLIFTPDTTPNAYGKASR